ncbi:MAG: hypothetical protein QG673_242 [Pseudomonadota bacterium]|nr:hypothetical protein [Pseudomonadota bacterium]
MGQVSTNVKYNAATLADYKVEFTSKTNTLEIAKSKLGNIFKVPGERLENTQSNLYLENAKTLIRFALDLNTNQISTFDTHIDPNNDLITTGHINYLKLNTHSWAEQQCTESAAYFISLVYIHYLSIQQDGMIAIQDAFLNKGGSLEKIKNAFFHNGGFAKNLKLFLTNELQIETASVDKILNRYLKNVEYDGTIFIKFKNVQLDITELLGDGVFKTAVHQGIKNSTIRGFFTSEEIKLKKEPAKNYFTNTVSSKIKQIPMVSADDKKRRQKLIVNLLMWIKMINIVSRSKERIIAQESYKDLVKLLPDDIITELGLNTFAAQMEFINHCRFLTFHQNHQTKYKMPLKVLSLLTLGIISLAVAAGVGGNAIAAENINNKILKYAAIGGDLGEGASHALVIVPVLKQAMFNGEGFFLDAGDSLETYTNSTQNVYALLASLYDGDDAYKYTDKTFKNSIAWNITTMTKDLIPNMNKLREIERHAFYNHFFNVGYQNKNSFRYNLENINYNSEILPTLFKDVIFECKYNRDSINPFSMATITLLLREMIKNNNDSTTGLHPTVVELINILNDEYKLLPEAKRRNSF